MFQSHKNVQLSSEIEMFVYVMFYLHTLKMGIHLPSLEWYFSQIDLSFNELLAKY